MDPFYIIEASGKRIPILISVPHCGTDFPDELRAHYDEKALKTLDDTDWFVDRLYDFASEMGITLIKAKYHRWVIDLNRDPDSVPLYDDGRIITGLCTTTDFFGNEIYKNASFIPNTEEVKRRLTLYYWPYYQEIEKRIQSLKEEFGEVLFYDAHSIRKEVKTISNVPFPDLILGTNDGRSSDKKFIDVALEVLSSRKYDLSYNKPFKGGHLTRYFGHPDQHQHALQLERAKIHYMDDTETQYDETRANEMKAMLKELFVQLAAKLN